MRSPLMVAAGALMLSACGRAQSPSPPDTAAIAHQIDDSVAAARRALAPLLADSARHTVATLLAHPETATFDSLMVVQPPKAHGAWPALVVCGRMRGKPGIDGRRTATPFIYENRLDVFLQQANNAAAFADLRARSCDNPAARVVLRNPR